MSPVLNDLPAAEIADAPISERSVFISFAHDVSAEVRLGVREAEVLALRGDCDAALRRLGALPAGRSDGHEDDFVAVAEMAALLRAWGSPQGPADALLDHCTRLVTHPRARGGVLLARSRVVASDAAATYARQALAEFSAAGDLRGRALALARLASATTSTASPEFRLRMGREAVDLAHHLGDPWTVAVTGGYLAHTETFLDEPGVMDRWREASLPGSWTTSPLALEVSSHNYCNWGLTAIGHGDYALAEQVLRDGLHASRGPVWQARFATGEAFLWWRRGDLASATRTLRRAELIGSDPYESCRVAIRAAIALERDRHLDATSLARALPYLVELSLQVACTAAGVLALTCHARREPNPTRDLVPILAQAQQRGCRFGWEDALLALTMINPAAAEAEVEGALRWPTYPRGVAIRYFIEGLLNGHAGYPLLRKAADALERLPEPITAGKALHAAAAVAPTLEEGNQLRWRAIALFQRCGADRSLAAVVRERRLHRGGRHVSVPVSQRGSINAGLTPKEREVAVLAARGMTAQEIADHLIITLGTARNYLARVRQKFGGVPKRQLAQVLSGAADLG